MAIAEPVDRNSSMNSEYKLTAYSLYAADSVDIRTDEIIENLKRLSKTTVTKSVTEFINLCTLSYGKVNLVLKLDKYFIESAYPEVMQILVKDPIVQKCMLKEDKEEDFKEETIMTQEGKNAVQFSSESSKKSTSYIGQTNDSPDITDFYHKMDKEDEDEEKITAIVSFRVNQGKIAQPRKRRIEIDYPLLMEFQERCC